MAEKPSVTCAVSVLERGSQDNRQVFADVDVAIERPLNGFHGTSLRYSVHPSLKQSGIEAFVKEQVAAKVSQATGVGYDAKEIALA